MAETMEATPDTATDNATKDQGDRTRDYARMRRIGSWHGAAVLAALTLWGAGNLWALESQLLVAQLVALGNALVAGTVLASLFHEWGHFLGARLSGSRSPVLAKPRRLYFMFNFDMEANTPRQFHWMSVGGLSGSWTAALVLFLLVPLETISAALLLSVVVANAVNASVFEVPIILRTQRSQNPQQELQAQLASPGLVRTPGLLAGLLTWLAISLPASSIF